MEEEKVVKKGRGGARPGAGRKPSGNSQRSLWLNDNEYSKVLSLLAVIRAKEQPEDLVAVLDVVRESTDKKDGMAGAVVLLDNVKNILKA